MSTTGAAVRPEPTRRGSTGVSTAFATFGELLQGSLPERDGDFLVTLPIAQWAMATFHSDPGRGELAIWPPHKRKSRRLATMIMESAGAPAGGLLVIDSDITEGKGLASSSADMIATARAVANALGLDLTPAGIESFLSRIEPTDGVLYPGIVAYHHRQVRLRAFLGSLPQMTVVGVEEGGMVDTIAFNRMSKPFAIGQKAEYERLLRRLTLAVATRDVAAVGRVATRSAELNQSLHTKRLLEPVLEICSEVGGLGVVTAHSGTTLGVLLDPADPAHPDQVAAAASAGAALAGNATVYRTLAFD